MFYIIVCMGYTNFSTNNFIADIPQLWNQLFKQYMVAQKNTCLLWLISILSFQISFYVFIDFGSNHNSFYEYIFNNSEIKYNPQNVINLDYRNNSFFSKNSFNVWKNSFLFKRLFKISFYPFSRSPILIKWVTAKLYHQHKNRRSPSHYKRFYTHERLIIDTMSIF